MQTTSTTDAGATRLGPIRFTTAAEIQTQAEAQERQKVERIERGQHLHAKIKRASKYYGQTPAGTLFKVFIDARTRDDYVVKGGPGGQYRLADVNLYVKGDDGRELKIS